MSAGMRYRATLFAAVLVASLAGLTARAEAASLLGVLVEPAPDPTARDRVILTVVGTEHPECPLDWDQPILESGTFERRRIRLHGHALPCGSPLPAETEFRKAFDVGLLAPGFYDVLVRVTGTAADEQLAVFTVFPATSTLTLPGFQVRVQWKDPRTGAEGSGWATRLTDQSGYFSFFDPKNVEVTVKILDGRPVNGHWWVFIASMTDLEVEVAVSRTLNSCHLFPNAGGLPDPRLHAAGPPEPQLPGRRSLRGVRRQP